MKKPNIDIHPEELSKIINLVTVVQGRLEHIEKCPNELIEIKKEIIHLEHLIDFIEKKVA
jgi:hypothetical protein